MIKFLLGAILAVLLSMNFHTVSLHESPAKPIAKRYQIDSFHQALYAFKQDTGRYPTDAEGLQVLRNAPDIKGWRGPYLRQDIPADPWNKPYKYRLHPEGYPIIN